MNNESIYVIMDNIENSNYILGYSDSESKAKKFCDDKELTTGKKYGYDIIHNIDYIKNERPKTVTFKVSYEVSRDMITINDITIIGKNKIYETEWPSIETDSEDRHHFYFDMEIDDESPKKIILNNAKEKADELLDYKYKNDMKFMYFINKQILLKEGVI